MLVTQPGTSTSSGLVAVREGQGVAPLGLTGQTRVSRTPCCAKRLAAKMSLPDEATPRPSVPVDTPVPGEFHLRRGQDSET